jgi:selenocysteine lyase/cysteine desulfurase
MTNRRAFFQTVAASAVAAPLLEQAARTQGLPKADDPAYWNRVRDQFMLARDKVFFNNGTIGAMPRVVFERTVEHLRKMATDVADWDYNGPDWIGGYSDYKDIRAKAARLMNADLREVAFTENVTCANSYVASGLELEAGGEILMSNQEHPGGESPWSNAAKRRNGTVVKMELPKPIHDEDQVLGIVRKSMTSRTKVLFLSHVITGAGAILPVKQICAEARQRGIFTVIDGAQAFGHIPVDVHDIGCDAYVGCFHKWLLAPAGTGFLYVRHERAKEVWSTLCSGNWANHDDDGYRFTQIGTNNLSLIMGLDAAMDFHLELGPQRVFERIQYLGDRLRAGLRKIPKVVIYSPNEPKMSAGITVYEVPGLVGTGGRKLQTEFWNRGRMRPRGSGNGVRHCTHIYNSPEEIDRALEIVRTLATA